MTDADRRQAAIAAIERQIAAAGLDAGAFSAEQVSLLCGALRAHAGELRAAKAGSLALRGLAARSASAVSAHLDGAVAPPLLGRFAALMPISESMEGGRAAGEASAAEYADAIATMFEWERAVGPDTRLRAAIQGRLAAVTRTCLSRIEAHLHVRSDEDFPDVRLLARDILRVEAVEWAVGIAGGPAAATELRHLAHHAARQAVQWAGRVFERFKTDPDEFTHFDAVATLSAADDLLVVILRVLEGDSDDRLAGSHPFVLTLGEQALQDFGGGLERMTHRYLAIAEAHLLAEGAEGAFVLSVLQLLQRVLRLGHALLQSVNVLEIRLNHETAVRRMTAMRATLRGATRKPGTPRDYAARLAVLDSALGEAAR